MAVHRTAALEQRDGVGAPSTRRRRTTWARRRSRTTRASAATPARVARQRDLARRREVEVERLQQVAEGGRVLWRQLVQEAQLAERGLLVACSPVSAASRSSPSAAAEPPPGMGASSRSLRRVSELLVVGRGREEPAALGVGEALEERVAERARLVEPALLERRLVQVSSASSRKAWSSR